MWTLGINWNFHDASAALVDERGKVWAMAEEERFTRSKHAWGEFPVRATAYCLDTVGIGPRDLGHVAVGWDMNLYEPWVESGTVELFERLFGPKPVAAAWPELVFVDHHLAHALVSFHGSAFERAAVLVMDGSGERASISIFAADRSSGLELKRSWGRTNSLGAMYEAATQAIGFGPLEGGKVMGLAPYASTVVDDLVLVDALLEGSIECPPWHAPGSDPEDDACVNAWLAYYAARFGSVTHDPDDLLGDPVALLIAAGAQRAVELAGAALHAEARRITGVDAVCLSGGVALNCVSNGRLPEPLYVPPMPHDSGVALGAAWYVNPPSVAVELSPFLGTDIDGAAPHDDGRFVVSEADPEAIVDLLVQGAIGAVAEGRAEIGPRALGHRSIIAIPSPAEVLTDLNERKGREPWRPLAPVARRTDAGRFWPEQGSRARYMVGSAQVHPDAVATLPAAVHVDGSTRPQALAAGEAPIVESVLAALQSAARAPVLINTSFNGPGEPIVDSAFDALAAFERLRLDFLVLGDAMLTKAR